VTQWWALSVSIERLAKAERCIVFKVQRVPASGVAKNSLPKRVGSEYGLNAEKMYISGSREAKDHLSEGSRYLVLAETH
jgi:hypothetical protein